MSSFSDAISELELNSIILAVLLSSFLFFLLTQQAVAVRVEMGGNRERAYMQMDGEPWQQPLGSADDIPAVVEIGKLPHASVMLSRK